MSGRYRLLLLGFLVLHALVWPGTSQADHLQTSATVSAQLKERTSSSVWVVEIRWTAGCTGARPGTPWYGGDLYLVDVDTGERIYAGGVVDTSGLASVSGSREWSVVARTRERRLTPELTIHCYENFPLHGGPQIVVTGAAVIIPRAGTAGGSGAGGSGGTGEGDYGPGDATQPLGAGGCVTVLLGTNGPDTLLGGDRGEIAFALGGNDLTRGRGGHDCLIGGAGNDRLFGDAGKDRLNGGMGRDELDGGVGDDRLNGGAGNDLLRGGVGNDRLFGDTGKDRLNGGVGNDLLHGGGGSDRLDGGPGRNRLDGGPGDDVLYASRRGGAPNLIIGGPGDDACFGVLARDRFRGCETKVDLAGLRA